MTSGIGLPKEAPKDEKPLLRPRQVHEMQDEVRRIEEMVASPPHVIQNVDVPAAQRHIYNLKHQLHHLSPVPFTSEERDDAVRREGELVETIRDGMCTAAEMRRNPPGAVDKHRRWERLKKPTIQQWKNHRLRMHAAGMLDHLPEDSIDVANVEILRQAGGSGELSMDHAQIPGAQIYLPVGPVAAQNVMDDEDKARLAAETGELLARYAAQGDVRAKEALVRQVGNERAVVMMQPHIDLELQRKQDEGRAAPVDPAKVRTRKE